MNYDLLIIGGTLVNHDGIGIGDVGVRDGKIVAIGDLKQASAAKTINAAGLHVLPGVIDTQVHFREPGSEAKEDLQTGSRAAVLGGVTAVFEMPNTNPTTSDVDALQEKLRLAKGRMHCDHAFYGGATNENSDILPDMEHSAGCCGIKVFMGASTGSLLVADDAGLARVLAKITRRAAFHSEDEPRMLGRKHLAVAGDWASHAIVRDAESAMISTKRLIKQARKAGKRIHVLHISTAEEIEYLAEHRDIATVEVTPQHLTLQSPDCYEQLQGKAQMNPPIRSRHHKMGLWAGIQNGVVDVIGSDHAPHLLDEKLKSYPASPSGMPGVQTLVPIMLDHVSKGRLSLQRFVDLTSAGANRIFQIAEKGRMTVGYDGDFTIVDLTAKRTIDDSWIASKCQWTPFAGREVTGWPIMTVIRGNIVMRDDEVISEGIGEPVKFQEVLG